MTEEQRWLSHAGEFETIAWLDTTPRGKVAVVEEPKYGTFRTGMTVTLDSEEFLIRGVEHHGGQSRVCLQVVRSIPVEGVSGPDEPVPIVAKLVEANVPDQICRSFTLEALERMAKGPKPRGVLRLWVEDNALWAEALPEVLDKLKPARAKPSADPLVDLARGFGFGYSIEGRRRAQADERVQKEQEGQEE